METNWLSQPHSWISTKMVLRFLCLILQNQSSSGLEGNGCVSKRQINGPLKAEVSCISVQHTSPPASGKRLQLRRTSGSTPERMKVLGSKLTAYSG